MATDHTRRLQNDTRKMLSSLNTVHSSEVESKLKRYQRLAAGDSASVMSSKPHIVDGSSGDHAPNRKRPDVLGASEFWAERPLSFGADAPKVTVQRATRNQSSASRDDVPVRSVAASDTDASNISTNSLPESEAVQTYRKQLDTSRGLTDSITNGNQRAITNIRSELESLRSELNTYRHTDYTALNPLLGQFNRSVTFNNEDTYFGGTTTTDSTLSADKLRSDLNRALDSSNSTVTSLPPTKRFTARQRNGRAAGEKALNKQPAKSILKQSEDEVQEEGHGLNFSYSDLDETAVQPEMYDDSLCKELIESQYNRRPATPTSQTDIMSHPSEQAPTTSVASQLTTNDNRDEAAGSAHVDTDYTGLFETVDVTPGGGPVGVPNANVKGLDINGRLLQPFNPPDPSNYGTMLLQRGNNRSLPSSSKVKFSGRVARETNGRALLGYDWIAGMLDDADNNSITDDQFEQLKKFRALNEADCMHPTPDTGLTERSVPSMVKELNEAESELTPLPPDPTHGCIHVYNVNERLYTVPVNSDMKGRSVCPICRVPRPKPTADQPGYVRISIPKGTLDKGYVMKPHRRNSFDSIDSMALKEHCLAGWRSAAPATVPPAKRVSLRQAVAGIKQQLAITVTEAEQLATEVKQDQLRMRSQQLLTQSHALRLQAQKLKKLKPKPNNSLSGVGAELTGYWPDEVVHMSRNPLISQQLLLRKQQQLSQQPTA